MLSNPWRDKDMSELTFTKSFLTSLDSKAQKLPADHVYDLKTFSPRIPYTLPKLPHPPHPILSKKATTAPIPGCERAEKLLTIHLKSARNPALHVTLYENPASTTTVFDLKEAVRKELVGDVGVDKVKVLLKRKPVSGDEKTVGEVLGEDLGNATDVEFGVMIMGGGRAKEQAVTPSLGTRAPEEEKMDFMEGVEKSQVNATETARATQGPVVEEVLRMEDFWTDLKGFLVQRLKVDEEMAGKVADRFRGGWEGGGMV